MRKCFANYCVQCKILTPRRNLSLDKNAKRYFLFLCPLLSSSSLNKTGSQHPCPHTAYVVEGDSVVSVANVESAFTEYHPWSTIFQLLFHFFIWITSSGSKDDFVRTGFLTLGQQEGGKLRACSSNCPYYASGRPTCII